MRDLCHNNPDIILTSDASGSWGCGAYTLAAWFQYQWPPSLRDQHITVKELLPIVIAAAIWGIGWSNKSILCRCDNEAVVHIINTGTSRDPQAMGLMRCLHFIATRFNLLLSAIHIAGIANSLADALSRDNLPLFFKHHPQANCSPSPIPLVLLHLLVHSRPDWTSPSWSNKFNTIFSQLSPRIQCILTLPATEGTQYLRNQALPHVSQYCASLSHTLHSNISSTRQMLPVRYQILPDHPVPSRPFHHKHAQAPVRT